MAADRVRCIEKRRPESYLLQGQLTPFSHLVLLLDPPPLTFHGPKLFLSEAASLDPDNSFPLASWSRSARDAVNEAKKGKGRGRCDG